MAWLIRGARPGQPAAYVAATVSRASPPFYWTGDETKAQLFASKNEANSFRELWLTRVPYASVAERS